MNDGRFVVSIPFISKRLVVWLVVMIMTGTYGTVVHRLLYDMLFVMYSFLSIWWIDTLVSRVQNSKFIHSRKTLYHQHIKRTLLSQRIYSIFVNQVTSLIPPPNLFPTKNERTRNVETQTQNKTKQNKTKTLSQS